MTRGSWPERTARGFGLVTWMLLVSASAHAADDVPRDDVPRSGASDHDAGPPPEAAKADTPAPDPEARTEDTETPAPRDVRSDAAPIEPDAPSTQAAPGARADSAGEPIVVWPTLISGGDAHDHAFHRPRSEEGTLSRRARDLDATLRDAVQDLGFTLDVSVSDAPRRTSELDMIERAGRTVSRGSDEDKGTWVVSGRLEAVGGDTFVLRLIAVAPRSKQLRVRIERVAGADVSVRGLVMLRDLLTAARPTPELEPKPEASASTGIVAPIRSPGRAVLAVNATLFGAFTAYSIQRASGSDDPRLMYPLLTLGGGLGLGAALLVAEEWDVRTGDAWTLAGGAWWGAAAGILVANGRGVQPLTDRYAWGIGAGLGGLALTTYVLSRGHADEGDAMLLHSGAVLGLSLGALGEYYASGDLRSTNPASGAGYGTAIGMVGGAALGALVTVSPSRVLLIDLGAGLGAATGAALASPLIFENLTEGRTRGFIAATAAGTVLGGGLAWWLTRETSNSKPDNTAQRAGSPLRVTPTGGVIGASATAGGYVPAYGIGAMGTF